MPQATAAPPPQQAAAARPSVVLHTRGQPSQKQGGAPPPSADAAFRHFFTRLSAADIHATATASHAPAASAAAPAAAAASVGPSAAPPLALECYRQLHSSMPLLHAHHLDALSGWLVACFEARVLPRSLSDDTPFELTPGLLEAVRAQARLPPVHSRLPGSKDSSAQMRSLAANSAGGGDGEEEEAPSFAEALAADAGRATAALSRRKGAAGAAGDPTTNGATEVHVPAPPVTVDGRMAAAAALYSVLLVHSLPVLVQAASAQTAPAPAALSPASATPLEFLSGIPLSLAAAARQQAAQRAAELAAVVRFEAEDGQGEDVPLEPLPERPEGEEDALDGEPDEDDFAFDADPVPEDSDVEAEEGAGGTTAWGSLDGIPVDAHAIEAQVASATHASPTMVDWISLRAKVSQLVSLWDSEIFTLGCVFEEQRVGEHMLQFWRLISRTTSRSGGGSGWNPALDGGVAVEYVRQQVLLMLRAQMIAHPHTGALHSLLYPCVQELLQLPHLLPGMGGAADATPESNQDAASHMHSQLERLHPERTLLALLSQLCTAASPHRFPSDPSPHASAPASTSLALTPTAVASIAFLHEFVASNLPWISRRLAAWRRRWEELLSSSTGRSLRFEPGVRADVEELCALCNVLAFFVWNHPGRKGSATTATGAARESSSDAGSQLLNSGVLGHVLSIVLLTHKYEVQGHVHHAVQPETQVDGSHAPQSSATVAHYCPSCIEYEDSRAESAVQLHSWVAADGSFSCAVQPYVSALASTVSASALRSPDGAVPLPSTSVLPLPLHVANQLLLLCATFSPSSATPLLSTPRLLSSLRCACFEELHVLPTVLLPFFLSLHTRTLDGASLFAQPATSNALLAPTHTPTPAPVATAAVSTQSKRVKEKKSKIVVAALAEDSEAKEEEASRVSANGDAAVEPDVFSWSAQQDQCSQALLVPLRRASHIVEQACAHLTAVDAAASPSAPAVPASVSGPLQLLLHAVHHLFLFCATSPQHRLLLQQLVITPASAGALSAFHPSRALERALLGQMVDSLRSLRTQLPALSKRLQSQLQRVAQPSSAAAAALQSDDSPLDEAQRSAHLTQLSLEGESADGHAQRQAKHALEQTMATVLRLQQELKNLFVEGAKKD